MNVWKITTSSLTVARIISHCENIPEVAAELTKRFCVPRTNGFYVLTDGESVELYSNCRLECAVELFDVDNVTLDHPTMEELEGHRRAADQREVHQINSALRIAMVVVRSLRRRVAAPARLEIK